MPYEITIVQFQKKGKNWLILIGFVYDDIRYNIERPFHLSKVFWVITPSVSIHWMKLLTSDTFLQNYPNSNFRHSQSWHVLPSVRLIAVGITLLNHWIIVINNEKSRSICNAQHSSSISIDPYTQKYIFHTCPHKWANSSCHSSAH